MKNFNTQIIAIIITTVFFSFNLFAGDEPSFAIYKSKSSSDVQFELCWLPGEKPTGTLYLNGNSVAVKGSADCIKTAVVSATAPYSFEIDGKVYKYSAGGAYVFTNPVMVTAGKGGVFSHAFTFGTSELPSAGLSSISVNGVSYAATGINETTYRISGVPAISGRMVVKAAGKTFIYDSQATGTIVQRQAPKARILTTGDVELEWEPNEIPDNLTTVRIGGVDHGGSTAGSKFVTTAKTFGGELGHKLVMNMKGATRSFSMAPTPGADASLLSRDEPSTKLVGKSTPTCGTMELTWNDPLEVPQNLRAVEINGTNYLGSVVGGKFTTTEQVSCASDGSYDMRLRDYPDPVNHSEILPIELSSFEAKYASREFVNIISWTVAFAENVEKYELMRSFDGENFDAIHSESFLGTIETSTFQYTDDAIPFTYSGWVYYRLRSVDIDGSVQHHKVAAVDFKGRNIITEVTTYPNPADTHVNINTKEKGTLYIFTQLGKIVRELEVEAGTTEIDLLDFAPGSYFGKFISTNGAKQTLSIQIAR